jgi:Flp pilus assembly pilin Flp
MTVERGTMQSYIQLRYWRAVIELQQNRRGQDMIEYALMAAFLSVAVAAFFPTSLAPNVSQIMSKATSLLARAPN